MEEDIKNLEEIINLCKEEINNNDKNITAILDLEDLKSLKNLLTRYNQLEEENKTLKNFTSYIFNEDVAEFIPTSLVKEKIEEYKKVIEITKEQLKHEENVDVRRRHTTTIEQVTAGILVLQDLLERSREDEIKRYI